MPTGSDDDPSPQHSELRNPGRVRCGPDAGASSILALPDEILVRILELTQGRRPLTKCTNNDDALLLYPTWARVTRVCTRLHAVALCAAELWTWIDYSCWPRGWADRCAVRAGARMLTVSMTVQNTTDARAAAQLLPRCQDAILRFERGRADQHEDDDTPAVNGWPGAYVAALQVAAPVLRSLVVGVIRMDTRLMLTPGVVGHFAALTHLEATGVRVDDAFDFPPGLRWLALRKVVVLCTLARLRRLFASVPYLEHLKIRDSRSQTDAVGEPLHNDKDKLSVHTTPLILPHLRSLNLSMSSSLIPPIMRVINIPSRSLHVQWYSNGVEAGLDSRICVHDFWLRFWQSTPSRVDLVPPLELRFGRHQRPQLLFDATGTTEYSCKLDILSSELRSNDPFLRHIAHVAFDLYGKHGSKLDLSSPALAELPALPTLDIVAREAWDAVPEVQRWAAGRPPLLVTFKTDAGPRCSGVRTRARCRRQTGMRTRLRSSHWRGCRHKVRLRDRQYFTMQHVQVVLI
jgi:hypothetical protein